MGGDGWRWVGGGLEVGWRWVEMVGGGLEIIDIINVDASFAP